VAERPSLRRGTSFVSSGYVSEDSSVRDASVDESRAVSIAMPSLRFIRRSNMVQRLIYVSEERRTPDRTVAIRLSRSAGREDSSDGGRGLLVNSSSRVRFACLRETDNS